jgi:hypothetical protein
MTLLGLRGRVSTRVKNERAHQKPHINEAPTFRLTWGTSQPLGNSKCLTGGREHTHMHRENAASYHNRTFPSLARLRSKGYLSPLNTCTAFRLYAPLPTRRSIRFKRI